MRLTVLGSGTLIPDDDRRSSAHLLEGDGFRLLLDCGFGTVHGFDRHGVAWRELTHVALSHFHTDHVGDLAPLLFALKHGAAERIEPLVLLGPPGLRGHLDALAAAHGDFVGDPGFPLEVVEMLRSGSWEAPGGCFRLTTHPTPHTDRSMAYRVETDTATLGYTGDTGESVEVADFLAGCDVVIAECSDPRPMENHLNPAAVAALARRAQPGLLLLVHPFPTLDPARIPDLVAGAGYTGRAAVAWDGTVVELAPGQPPRLRATS